MNVYIQNIGNFLACLYAHAHAIRARVYAQTYKMYETSWGRLTAIIYDVMKKIYQ